MGEHQRRKKEVLSGCHFPYLETRAIRFFGLRNVLMKTNKPTQTHNTEMVSFLAQSIVCLFVCWLVLVHYSSGLEQNPRNPGAAHLGAQEQTHRLQWGYSYQANHILKCFAELGPPRLRQISFSSTNLPSLLPKGQRKSLFYFLLNLADLLQHIIFILSICTTGIEHQQTLVTGDSRKQSLGNIKANG